MLALALALQAAGHQAVLAAPPEHERRARDCGCAFAGLGSGMESFLSGFRDAHSLKASLAFTRFMRREVGNQLAQFPGILVGADLVLGASLVLALPTVAEWMGIPYRFVAFTPQMLPSGCHPVPLIRHQHLPSWVNRLSWNGARILDRGVFEAPLNRRRREWGLGPTRGLWDGLLGMHVVVASDPEIAPVPADVTPIFTQTGYLQLEQKGELGKEVEEFLDDGLPPVYFGFGSMPREDQSALRPLLLDAGRKAGRRVMVPQLRRNPARITGPRDICFVGDIPHNRLFPRTAVVVHHGGAGTTATACRAGVPQIVIPHILDQYYWAERVHRLGLGPRPIWRCRLTRTRLRAAVADAVSNEGYASRAREFSQGLGRKHGLDKAVRLIESDAFLMAGRG